MKKLILILAIAALSAALFAQTENLNVVTGLTQITPQTSDATIILDISDCNGQIHTNDDADVMDFRLPSVQKGLIAAFANVAAGVITVDPFDGVDYIMLHGVSVGAGAAITSAGDVGDYIVLIGLDDTRWWALPFKVLTWIGP